jgi:hypothetical protein
VSGDPSIILRMPTLSGIGTTVDKKDAFGAEQFHRVVCATAAPSEAFRNLSLYSEDSVRIRDRPGPKTSGNGARAGAEHCCYIAVGGPRPGRVCARLPQ